MTEADELRAALERLVPLPDVRPDWPDVVRRADLAYREPRADAPLAAAPRPRVDERSAAVRREALGWGTRPIRRSGRGDAAALGWGTRPI